MSALTAPRNPQEFAGEAGAASARATLRAVPKGSRKVSQIPFIIFIAVLLACGLAGVLVLSTTIQTDSAELGRMQAQESELRYQEAALIAQAQNLRSSQRLAEQAWEAGMRPNPNPAFIRISDGAVVGAPDVTRGDELPGIVPPADHEMEKPEIGVRPASSAPSSPAPSPHTEVQTLHTDEGA